nr:uncharacterized protein LOC127313110 [Lolium perenne]
MATNRSSLKSQAVDQNARPDQRNIHAGREMLARASQAELCRRRRRGKRVGGSLGGCSRRTRRRRGPPPPLRQAHPATGNSGQGAQAAAAVEDAAGRDLRPMRSSDDSSYSRLEQAIGGAIGTDGSGQRI